MGEKWRTPSKKDFEELNSIKTRVYYNDGYNSNSGSYDKIKGLEFIGKNDESLLFIYSYRQDGGKLYGHGYWTSTPGSSSKATAIYSNSSWGFSSGVGKSEAKCIKPIMNK